MISNNFSTNYLIIGGGIAGVTCAEWLKIESPEEDVILVSSSAMVKACTNVRQVAKVLVDFDIEEQDATTLDKSRVRFIRGVAKQLNSDRHEIVLSDGSVIKYKKLSICTGGKPKLINETSPYVLGIRDTESVQVMQKKLEKSRRVMIVGNGGIATELAYELEGCEVIWAIRDSSIGATFFDPGAAQFFLPFLGKEKSVPDTEGRVIKRTKYTINADGMSNRGPGPTPGSALGPDWATSARMKGQGKSSNVHVEYSCEVSEILSPDEAQQRNLKPSDDKDSWPVYVQLTNNRVYGCDFVVSATGVVPLVENFLPNNDLEVSDDGGFLVDTQMQTSVEDVYAAGDVCTPRWPPSKNWFQMRLWTQARQMGAYAAHCMVSNSKGHLAELDICFDLFTHCTRFFGYKVVLLGLYNGQKLGSDCELLLRVTSGVEYAKVVLREGRVRGAVLIGETDLEETFENLILNELDVAALGEDLLNPNVDIEDYFD